MFHLKSIVNNNQTNENDRISSSYEFELIGTKLKYHICIRQLRTVIPVDNSLKSVIRGDIPISLS